MTPIHEMKTRKAAWVSPTHPDNPRLHSYQDHGAFFEVDGREVGVVIRDQPEAVAKPLIEAIAALPSLISALLTQGHRDFAGNWHTIRCWDTAGDADCLPECRAADEALKAAGALP